MPEKNLDLSTVLNSQPNWYRGDFHAHTNYSDGKLTPTELVDVARSEGLDFFAITDHNTIDAYPHFGYQTDVLVIPGIEVTAKIGHFNVFGVDGNPDWLSSATFPELSGSFDTTTSFMKRTASEGLLNSINHPCLHPWAWLDLKTPLSNIHCLEIWNDPSWPDNKRDNPRAVAMWTAWLNAGYRITAIGGSDYHRPTPAPIPPKPPDRLGLPSTYVFADSLSGTAILDALRQQRAYVSMGAQVLFRAQIANRLYDIGADIGEASGQLTLEGTVLSTPKTGQAQIICNGKIIAETNVDTHEVHLHCTVQARSDELCWYRFDVWDEDGQILALTNPIFIGPKYQPKALTYGDFVSDLD